MRGGFGWHGNSCWQVGELNTLSTNHSHDGKSSWKREKTGDTPMFLLPNCAHILIIPPADSSNRPNCSRTQPATGRSLTANRRSLTGRWRGAGGALAGRWRGAEGPDILIHLNRGAVSQSPIFINWVSRVDFLWVSSAIWWPPFRPLMLFSWFNRCIKRHLTTSFNRK